MKSKIASLRSPNLIRRLRRDDAQESRKPKRIRGNLSSFVAFLDGYIRNWDERHDPTNEVGLRLRRQNREFERHEWLDGLDDDSETK